VPTKPPLAYRDAAGVTLFLDYVSRASMPTHRIGESPAYLSGRGDVDDAVKKYAWLNRTQVVGKRFFDKKEHGVLYEMYNVESLTFPPGCFCPRTHTLLHLRIRRRRHRTFIGIEKPRPVLSAFLDAPAPRRANKMIDIPEPDKEQILFNAAMVLRNHRI
jgi:hypothetical protein